MDRMMIIELVFSAYYRQKVKHMSFKLHTALTGWEKNAYSNQNSSKNQFSKLF